METTAFFEKKINLTPNEFNKAKNQTIDSLLELKAKELIENKCSEQGFVLPGTIKLISRSMGYFESARFTGDAIYYVKMEGKVIYPADGVRISGEVIRKNKMGLYVNYRDAIRIQVPRDLHIGSEEYEEVEVGDIVEVELKRSKFQINDPYILASAIFITKKTGTDSTQDTLPVVEEGEEETEEGEEQEETEEGEDEEEEQEEKEQLDENTNIEEQEELENDEDEEQEQEEETEE